jgi:hypothetical protein
LSARLQRGRNEAPAGDSAAGTITRHATTPAPSFKIPYIDEAVLTYLRSVFPAAVQRNKDLRDYDFEAGQQDVLAHLEMRWQEQNSKG